MPKDEIAVAYIRVSTEKQALGPDGQREKILTWCDKHGISLACDPFVDAGVSGAKDVEKRPAMQAALEALESYDAKILVAHKRDRIARDRAVMGHLELTLRRKGRVLCSTDQDPPSAPLSPVAKAMEGIKDIFAEMERGMIKARTKSALDAKRRKGERLGGEIPYGYRVGRDGKKLRPLASEQKVITLVKKLREGGLSLRKIAIELDRRGYMPRNGKRWHAKVIRSLASKPPRNEGQS